LREDATPEEVTVMVLRLLLLLLAVPFRGLQGWE
jgi:hypothetical protein